MKTRNLNKLINNIHKCIIVIYEFKGYNYLTQDIKNINFRDIHFKFFKQNSINSLMDLLIKVKDNSLYNLYEDNPEIIKKLSARMCYLARLATNRAFNLKDFKYNLSKDIIVSTKKKDQIIPFAHNLNDDNVVTAVKDKKEKVKITHKGPHTASKNKMHGCLIALYYLKGKDIFFLPLNKVGFKDKSVEKLKEYNIDNLKDLYVSFKQGDINKLFDEDLDIVRSINVTLKSLFNENFKEDRFKYLKIDYNKEKVVSYKNSDQIPYFVLNKKSDFLSMEKTFLNQGKKTIKRKKKRKKKDNVLAKFENYNTAREYKEKYFLTKIGDWDNDHPGSELIKKIVFRSKIDDFTYSVDSKEEQSLIKKLEKLPEILHIRTGTYEIKLSRKHSYYPDVFFQTTDGRIGIIEVKPLAAMADITVLNKWEKLKAKCRGRILCYICDRNFNSYDKFEHIRSNKTLEEYVANKIEECGEFTYLDYKEFKVTNNYKVNSPVLDKQLAKLSLENDYIYDLNYFKKYEFRISKGKK